MGGEMGDGRQVAGDGGREAGELVKLLSGGALCAGKEGFSG